MLPVAQFDQLRARLDFTADSLVELVRLAGISIDPRKATAYRRIVRAIVNGAGAVAEQHAAAIPHASAPFTPAGPVNQTGAVIGFDRLGLLGGERCTVCTA